MAELTSKHKNMLRVSVIGGVLLTGLFGWLGYTDYKARETALEDVARKQAELDRADAQIREIPKLEEQVIVLRENVNAYVRILPDDKEITEFVDHLTQFAAKSDVRVKKLDDADARARSGRNKRGATVAFDRVVYKISLDGNCEQLLNFMDLFENHERFVKISAFKIKSDENPKKDVDPTSIPHQIDLDLETYVYNPKAKSKGSVQIPNEAQKLERLKAAGLVGAEGMDDLALASYRHEAGTGRRDVFYDPRYIGAQRLRATEEEKEAQRTLLEGFIARLGRLASDLAAEQRIDNTVRRLQAREKVNKDLVMFGGEIGRAKTERVFTVEELRSRFDKEVDQTFQKLVEGRDLNIEAAPVLGQQIEEHVAKMRVAMDDNRYEEVVTLHDEVTRMSASVAGADIRAHLKEAEAMHRVARAHLDFAARPISFGGAVCFDDDPSAAVVIINGRSYGPGESVDHDLVVKAITPAQITFEFRGIVLTQPMKSSAPRQAGPAGAAGKKRKT